MTTMELRLLKYFLAVARLKNITSAAKALHVSQPTLSKQLSDLEHELGHRLFDRGTRTTSLTEEGRLLERRAREIIELSDIAVKEIKGETGEMSGAIRIGAGEVRGMRVVADAVRDIRRKHPAVNVVLKSGNADDVRLYLKRGLVDIALFVGTGDYSDYNVIELPDTNCWGLLVSEKHLLARKKNISPSDLKDVALFAPWRIDLSTAIATWLGHPISDLNLVGEMNLLYNAAFFAENGTAAVLTIDGIIENDPSRHLKFIPLKPRLETPNFLVWRKDIPLPAPTTALIKMLSNAKQP